MRKIFTISIVIIFLLHAIGAVGTLSDDKIVDNFCENYFRDEFDDISAYRYHIACEGKVPSTESSIDRVYPVSEIVDLNPYIKTGQSSRVTRDYPIGEIIWQYYITGGSDNSVQAITPIPDINDDEIDDVIVCSEDYYVRCFDGGAIGTGVVLWENFIYSGKLWCQNELTITQDVNGDGYKDVVVGTPWGDRSVHTLSGKTGNEIWKYDTHVHGDGGWIYQVDCSYDYNDDDVIDVLAAAGGTSTGARRVYCLDGLDGDNIWDCPLGSPKGPGFSVIGIEDFTGDGQPDVLAGASNSDETVGYAYGINGATGSIIWTFTVGGSSVWALEQINDITGDGIKDVIIGDSFEGNIYGLDATDGSQEYYNSIGSVSIVRFEKLNDVNGDGHPDILPAHSTIDITQVIDGQSGNFIWTHPVADQPWNVARTSDISGDGIDDVLVGTLYNSGYCYFLNGVNGTELCSKNYYEAVDAIAAIPDVVNDGSMEMVAGGRNGKVVCFSGGLNAYKPGNVTADFIADTTEGKVPLRVRFTDLSTAENTTITSWKWNFDNDSIIDSEEQNPIWTYNEEGIYTVTLTVSDGIVSDSETKVDYINVFAGLDIKKITGGLFKVSAEIENMGSEDVNNVNWSITFKGGAFIGKKSEGQDLEIPAGKSKTVDSKLIIGFGPTTITVTAEIPEGSDTRKQNGFVLLFYITVNPGGGI